MKLGLTKEWSVGVMVWESDVGELRMGDVRKHSKSRRDR